MDKRLQNEIEHGKFLAREGAGEIWNWESPAGKVRWKRRVAMLTSHIKPTDNVLEIGCGTGYFTREIVLTGARITAIDISPELLNLARIEVNSPNVEFREENAYAMTLKDETFDTVIGSSVLHHLQIQEAIGEIYRVLKPGGTIQFTEPNMMNPQIALQKNIPYLKRKLGDSPDETAFFRRQLKKLLTRHNFINIQVKPFDFLHPAIPERWIQSVDKKGKYLEDVPLIREIAGSLYIKAMKSE